MKTKQPGASVDARNPRANPPFRLLWSSVRGGCNHLTDFTCRVPRDDWCLISGLPTPSSSCSTSAKTKKIQRRWERGKHETCARECCCNQIGLFKQLTYAPWFQGTNHALLTDVNTYLTIVWLHRRQVVTASGFDVHTQRVLEVEVLAVHRELRGLYPSLSALFNELAAAQCIPTPACTGANG